MVHRPVAGECDNRALPAFRGSSLWTADAEAGEGAGKAPADASGMNTPRVGHQRLGVPDRDGADIVLFTEISGDRNPIHYDAELAAASRFGGVVVQGGVTSGLLNALVAEQLPGPGSVFLEVGWRFLAPVRPGDVITAQATVTAARDDKPVTTLATQVTNQAGITVLDGTAVVWRDPVVAAAATVHRTTSTKPPDTSGISKEREHSMTITTENPRTNGVDTATLFATLDAVKGQPEIAKFQFRATQHMARRDPQPLDASPASTARCRRWSTSTSPRSTPTTRPSWSARTRRRPRSSTCSTRIAACLTSGIANIAAVRGVQLTRVSSTVEGDIDLLGILGLSDGSVRNGYEQIKVTLHVEGDADDATLRAHRRAVASPLGRVRRADPAHARRHRGGHRLTAGTTTPARIGHDPQVGPTRAPRGHLMTTCTPSTPS